MQLFESMGFGIYLCVLAAVLGLIAGSFLNCTALRIVSGERFTEGRSHCVHCGHTLGAADLVPLFSWLFLRGRCRYCGEPISKRYPLTEAFMAVMSVICLCRFGLTAVCLRNAVFLCCLFCLSLVDYDSFRIPNLCVLLPAAAWLAALPFGEAPAVSLRNGLLGAAAIGGGVLILSLIMDRVLGKESMGGGDIKLLSVCGLFLGPVGGLFMLMLACILGLVMIAVLHRKNGEGQFPFGPAISAAAWIMLLAGEPLIRWYLSLMG